MGGGRMKVVESVEIGRDRFGIRWWTTGALGRGSGLLLVGHVCACCMLLDAEGAR